MLGPKTPVKIISKIISAHIYAVLLFVCSPAYGDSIDIGEGAGFHWDDWLFEYTPAAGWSSKLDNGTDDSTVNLYIVNSDTLPVGAPVPLVFTFSYYIRLDPLMENEWENFDGSSAGFAASAPFVVSSGSLEGGFGFETEFSDSVSGASPSLFKSGTFGFDGVAAVGENFLYPHFSGHVAVEATDLKVFDPDSAASFLVTSTAEIKVIDIQFASAVPDGDVTTAAFLDLSIAGLVFARRRMA